MAIGLICINCGAKIKVPESAAGKMGKCPKCKEVIRVFETASLSAHICDQCGKSLAGEKTAHKHSGKLYCGQCFTKLQRGKLKKGTEAVKPFDLEVGKSSEVPAPKKGTRKLGKGQRAADKFLIRLLEEQNIIKASDIEPMLKYQVALGKRFIPLVRDVNLTSEEGIVKTISETTGIAACPPGELEVSDVVLDLLNEGAMDNYDVLPLSREGDKVILAFPNPLDINAIQKLGLELGLRVVPQVCTWSQYKKGRLGLRLLAKERQNK